MRLRLMALLLAVLTLLPLVTACKKDGDGEDDSASLSLLQDGACTVVFDEDTTTTKVLNRLVEAIENAAGITVSTARKPSENGTQILLGKVNCEDGKAATDGLRLLEYTVGIYGNSYVISGFDASSTASAANYFIDKVLPKCAENDWVVRASANYTLTKDYELVGVTIGGKNLKDFTIGIPSDYTPAEYRTALALQEHLSDMAGYPLEIVTAKKKSAQIRIGASICSVAKAEEKHSWRVACSGSIMEMVAECDFGYQALMGEMATIFDHKSELRAYTDDTKFEGTGNNASQIPLQKEGDVRVMFNNIHGNASQSEFPVGPCNQMLSEMYKEFMPDVLGLQECSEHSRNAGIVNLLKPLYTEVTPTLGDNLNNSTPLFYRSDTVQLLKSGFFRFNSLSYNENEYKTLLNGSTASDVKSRAKDASKSFTWGIFKDKATGKVFMVASVHLWWKNENKLDEAARSIQIAKLKAELNSQAQSYASSKGISMIPIFVGGDYNCHANMDSFNYMSATGTGNDFTDLNTLAPADRKVTTSTHHGYATYNKELGVYENPQKVTGKYEWALDYVFGNTGKAGGCFTVKGMGISTDEPCLLSTDHCPIYIDFDFTATAPKIN